MNKNILISLLVNLKLTNVKKMR